MGFLNKPSIDQVNPNPSEIQGLQSTISDFLISDVFGSSDVFEGVGADLQGGAGESILTFLGQDAPEVSTFENLEGGLLDIFGQDNVDEFGEAAFPLFQRGLQDALGQLSSSGAGRFSTAFEQQGVGLGQRALQDFNLLQQQAFQQNVSNRLGAADLLGTLASRAGDAPFNRAATAFGLGTQARAQDPRLQALLGGMQFGRPAPLDTVVGPSPLDQLLRAGSIATLAFGGG